MILNLLIQTIFPGEDTRFAVNPPHVCLIRNVALTSLDERLEIDYCIQRNTVLSAFCTRHPVWTPADCLQVKVTNRSRVSPLETGVKVYIDRLDLHSDKDPCVRCGILRERHHEETHRFRERCTARNLGVGCEPRCVLEIHGGECPHMSLGLRWEGES